MNEQQSEFRPGEVFYHKARKKYFIITKATFINRVQKGSKSKVKDGQVDVWDWLYDVMFIDDTINYKRYYQSRLLDDSEMKKADAKTDPDAALAISLYEEHLEVA